MHLWNIVWYNGGKGPGEYNNPYWGRYRRARTIWVSLMLTLLGVGIGLVSLFISSTYLQFIDWEIFLSYLHEPLLLLLNLLPCVLLVWLFYFLTGRSWAGFTLAAAVVFVLSLVNYYKIRLRSEPLLVSDLLLAGEAAGILGRYTIEITGRALSAPVALFGGLFFSVLFLRGALKKPLLRLIGFFLTLALLLGLFFGVYLNNAVYQNVKNNSLKYNTWSDLATFVSKGFLFPFLHSAGSAISTPPEGYSVGAAEEILTGCTDADIPAEKKINIISVMFEAYTDLSEYPQLLIREDVYAPLHQIYAESLHGHLNVNIFGGGTVNTERNFLTGYFLSEDYRAPTNSHVWYLRSQGYYAEGYHAGDSWFYNRQNIERNLGLENFYFLEDYPDANRYDYTFFPVLTSLYQNRDKSIPYFNFSITYQNHGAYRTDTTYEESFLERGSLSETSYNILNDYLHGIADTSNRMLTFLDSLRDDPEPVAVIFFGDHMPWMGDGNSVLHEAGINIDFATEEGFYNYYGTPYIIWANEAAKAVTGSDFVGEGERVSPGYLMNLLFREWGIEGGAWAQYNASLLDRMEIANTGSSIYRIDGALYTAAMLEGDGKQMVSEHKIAEYYWKRHFAYRSVAG